MRQFLLICDANPLYGIGSTMRHAGYDVATVSSGQDALDLLARRRVDLIISDLALRDMSGLELLRKLRERYSPVPFVMAGSVTIRDAVTAMRLGAADVIEKPIAEDGMLRTIRSALPAHTCGTGGKPTDNTNRIEEAHAAARWARAVAPVINSPKDPRTVTDWSRIVFVSPGALRNWCHTAGVSARRSLVFGRLLRVACFIQAAGHRPEDLLDVVDRRTLVGLLKYAGLNPEQSFPIGSAQFLQQQGLIRDPVHLCEIRRAISVESGSRPINSGPASSRVSSPVG